MNNKFDACSFVGIFFTVSMLLPYCVRGWGVDNLNRSVILASSFD